MGIMTDTDTPDLKLHTPEDVEPQDQAPSDDGDRPEADDASAAEAEATDQTTDTDAPTDADAAADAPEEPVAPADEVTDELAERGVVEAILFATESPLKPAKIAEVAGLKGVRSVKKYIKQLNTGYEQTGAAFRIEEIAEGFQMLTLPQYNEWLCKLLTVRQESRLTQAGLETLAIVAYKQPVLRADVEAIRGVSCGEMLNRLREANLIKIVGRAEDVGRPILYGTTKQFLEVFGLGSLDDLPQAEELLPPQ